MIEVKVKAWTDWSTGVARPMFSVEPKFEGEFTVETLKTAMAAEILEHRLAEVSEEIHKLARTIWVGSEGYSKYALYAMVFLAAAWANVNPAHIKFVYRGSFPEESYDIYSMFSNLVKEIFDPKYNVMKHVVETRRRVRQDANVSRTWKAVDELAQIISMVGDEPDELIRILLIYLLESLTDETKTFKSRVYGALFAQEVKAIFQKAARKARDPDVKRLAEIFEEIIDGAVGIAKELESYLDFRVPHWLLDELSSPEKFKKGKKIVLKKLEKARDEARKIEDKVEQLISEAKKIIERLNEESILLPRVQREAEEDPQGSKCYPTEC